MPDELPERRTPESVTDSEVAEVAVELVARMLHDVRDLRHERRQLRDELADAVANRDPGPARVACRARFPVLRHVLLRGEHAEEQPPPSEP